MWNCEHPGEQKRRSTKTQGRVERELGLVKPEITCRKQAENDTEEETEKAGLAEAGGLSPYEQR